MKEEDAHTHGHTYSLTHDTHNTHRIIHRYTVYVCIPYGDVKLRNYIDL